MSSLFIFSDSFHSDSGCRVCSHFSFTSGFAIWTQVSSYSKHLWLRHSLSENWPFHVEIDFNLSSKHDFSSPTHLNPDTVRHEWAELGRLKLDILKENDYGQSRDHRKKEIYHVPFLDRLTSIARVLARNIGALDTYNGLVYCAHIEIERLWGKEGKVRAGRPADQSYRYKSTIICNTKVCTRLSWHLQN